MFFVVKASVYCTDNNFLFCYKAMKNFQIRKQLLFFVRDLSITKMNGLNKIAFTNRLKTLKDTLLVYIQQILSY